MMKFEPIHTDLFTQGQDLPAFITRHIAGVEENTILVVSSKIVGLWKNCVVPFESVAQKEALIKAQSTAYLKTSLAWLTIKDGMVMTNAGIDESNANGKLILLPNDLYACAEQLCHSLKEVWKVSNFGIIITDSMILPLRAGVIGASVGYSGFRGVNDLRGKADLCGRRLKTTLVDVADSISAAAALTMGEADEKNPLCVVTGAPVAFTGGTDPDEIKYPLKDDLYGPLFKAAKLETTGEKQK